MGDLHIGGHRVPQEGSQEGSKAQGPSTPNAQVRNHVQEAFQEAFDESFLTLKFSDQEISDILEGARKAAFGDNLVEMDSVELTHQAPTVERRASGALLREAEQLTKDLQTLSDMSDLDRLTNEIAQEQPVQEQPVQEQPVQEQPVQEQPVQTPDDEDNLYSSDPKPIGTDDELKKFEKSRQAALAGTSSLSTESSNINIITGDDASPKATSVLTALSSAMKEVKNSFSERLGLVKAGVKGHVNADSIRGFFNAVGRGLAKTGSVIAKGASTAAQLTGKGVIGTVRFIGGDAPAGSDFAEEAKKAQKKKTDKE